MKAVVAKGFDGAPDGEIYPRHFMPGQLVEGDLARVAIAQEWAVEGDKLPEGTEPTAPVEIPAKWDSLNASDTIDLARKLGADESVKTKAAAADFIKAEIDKRAAAATAEPQA